jgi:broad specificity phosphatase PhoE
MKLRVCFTIFAVILLIAFVQVNAPAQNKKLIILVRHAEKLPPVDTDNGDPDLSPDGRQRAERLMNAIRKYRPREIFVTDYKRTRQTAEPIAKLRKVTIQQYDTRHQSDLIAKMMASKTKQYLIVGHSDSIPALANLLMKKEVFKQLPDPEYAVLWVVRMKNGIVTRVEVFPY